MGLTIGYSLMASLLVALTLVPVLGFKTIAERTKEKKQRLFDSVVLRVYEKLLEVCSAQKSRYFDTCIACCLF
jgi:Cu/Ag efflux pump CusA